jgi:uncharacterized protein (DUF433 family)
MAEVVSLLDRPVMTVGEAARQLRIPVTTLERWIEGGRRKDVWYSPVLREKPTGTLQMTWGEIVEARYLRAYRDRSVSLQTLRDYIEALRETLGTPYPLAHSKPFIGSGRRLVLQAQEQAGLPRSLWTVYEATTGQLILGAPAENFFDRVDFSDKTGEAEALRPATKMSPVTMRPNLSSGAATVGGTRTEILAEASSTGMTVDEIAEDFRLTSAEVRAALSYEWDQAA